MVCWPRALRERAGVRTRAQSRLSCARLRRLPCMSYRGETARDALPCFGQVRYRARMRFAWLCCASALSMSVACNEAASKYDGVRRDENGCPTPFTCDIRESGCQNIASQVAACLRGDAPHSVSIAVTVIDADT